MVHENDTGRFRLRTVFTNYITGRRWTETTHLEANGHTGTELTNALIAAIEQFEEFAATPF